MRVKCVDNWFYEHLIKVGVIYEVLEYSYGYAIKPGIIIDKNKFVVIEEDKMEETRVVRKLEDLDGLENGTGLKVVYENDKERVVTRLIKGHKTAIGWFTLNDVANFGLDYILDVIKSMGFKFDYKPSRRSLEEVIEEMRLNSKNFSDEYRYTINKPLNKYCVYKKEDFESFSLGTWFFNKKTAQKYADELNEIIGVGK